MHSQAERQHLYMGICGAVGLQHADWLLLEPIGNHWRIIGWAVLSLGTLSICDQYDVSLACSASVLIEGSQAGCNLVNYLPSHLLIKSWFAEFWNSRLANVQ